MNAPIPSRLSTSLVPVAIVGLAGAVAGSLAVWMALTPAAAAATEHTCHCECASEPAPALTRAPPASQQERQRTASADENGAGAAPVPSGPRVRQAAAEVVGPLDRDIVRRIVRAHINEVRYCYNEGLAEDPALSGRVVAEFEIGAAGTVVASDVASSTLEDDGAVGACVAKAVKRWKFPKFDGDAVLVTYPFVLSPGA